jgi:type II secretory pathway pseudopilin PulG
MYEGEENNFNDAPPEESNNRTFLIAAGILGGIVLLSIACLAAYALLVLPKQRQSAQAATNLTATAAANENTIRAALTATFQASILPTTTPIPTSTPPIAVATNTSTPSAPAFDPSTATVSAALTQAAVAQLTVVGLPTSTALPGTGIADEYGAPGLVVMALAFMIVILLARRLRASPVSNR